jgi:hypothetical protein
VQFLRKLRAVRCDGSKPRRKQRFCTAPICGEKPVKECKMLKLKKDRFTQSTWCAASREDLWAAVQCLRDNSIIYVGPFVINAGVAVFKVSDYLVTADELVSLWKAGHLTREGVNRFSRDLEAEEKIVLEPRR